MFNHSGYPLAVRHSNERYARGSFDFLAGYVVPEDAWYIIPAAKFAGVARLTLCSTSDEAHWEEYREAWNLLREAVGAHSGDGGGDAPPANEAHESEEKPSGGLPTNAFGRLQAAMNFCKKQMRGAGMGSDEDEKQREDEG